MNETKAIERRLEEEAWYAGKIREALDYEDRCRRALESAKEEVKDCKDQLEAASTNLRAIIRDRDSLASRPILTVCEPMAEAETTEAETTEAETTEAETTEAETTEAEIREVHFWMDEPLTSILADADADADADATGRIYEALEANAVALLPPLVTPREVTAGDVHDLFEAGVKIDALALSDEHKVTLLESLRAWSAGYGWHSGVERPEGFPNRYLTTDFHDLAKVVKRVKAREKKARLRKTDSEPIDAADSEPVEEPDEEAADVV